MYVTLANESDLQLMAFAPLLLSLIMSNLYISADLKGNCLLQPDFAVVDIPLNLFEIKSLFLFFMIDL